MINNRKLSTQLPSIIYLTRSTRDILNSNEVFTKKELTFLFGDKEIVIWLKMNGYLCQSSDCRWRKAEKLNELLAEGIEQIQTTI